MLEESDIRWIDMIDPVYTLAKLAGIPDDTKIDGIAIQNMRLIVWYTDENGAPRHISKGYNL